MKRRELKLSASLPLLVDNAEVFIRIATTKSVGYNRDATEKKDALWVTDGSEAQPYDQVQQLWDK